MSLLFTKQLLLLPYCCCRCSCYCRALFCCIFCLQCELQGMLLGSLHLRFPEHKHQTQRAAAAPYRLTYSTPTALHKPTATAVISSPTAQQFTSTKRPTAESSSFVQVTSRSSNSRSVAGSSRNSGAPRRVVPVMVEGHQCHRVGHAHRRLLVGKAFDATSPNGRFVEGEKQHVVCLLCM
jgi:hypothetical protein